MRHDICFIQRLCGFGYNEINQRSTNRNKVNIEQSIYSLPNIKISEYTMFE